MSELIAVLQNNAPLIVIFGFGLWQVLSRLHRIDKRLVRVETKLGVKEDDPES